MGLGTYLIFDQVPFALIKSCTCIFKVLNNTYFGIASKSSGCEESERFKLDLFFVDIFPD